MIFTSKPVTTFQKMLDIAGFNNKNPNYLLACQIFKEFSNQRVKCNDDALLFQYGCDFEEKFFYWDLVRQFVFNKFGDYDHMEQLTFTSINHFLFPLSLSPTKLYNSIPHHYFPLDYNAILQKNANNPELL